MSWHQEQDELVIDGFEKGIGDSPYSGLTDLRNVNLISVPGEASAGFSTSQQSAISITNTFTVNTGTDFLTVTGTNQGSWVEPMAVTVSNSGGGLPAPLAAATTYYVLGVSSNTFQLSLTAGGSAIDITTTGSGTQTITTLNMGKPMYGTVEYISSSSTNYYLIDSNGRAWVNGFSYVGKWVFLKNTTLTNANGNGIVVWHGYLLVFRNALIDYISTAGTIFNNSWSYGWQTMNSAAGSATIHDAIVAWVDDRVYYCDGQFVGSLFQNDSAVPFDPTTGSTYTWSSKALILLQNEIAQCLAVLNANLLVGGAHNLIYSWNRTSSGGGTFTGVPIALAENNVVKMVTVNTNTYALVGTRGRIYITNGSQAQLFKKVPDHISGTVEPIYTWGGLSSQRNQLYFGLSATDNSGSSATNQYGGVWAIDIDTVALRFINQLSYAAGTTFGSYPGICTLLISPPGGGAGYGLFMGWDSGSSTYGVDVSSAAVNSRTPPYTGGQSYAFSEMIPVGTFLRPKTFEVAEYKLSMPLVAGESVQIKVGSSYADYVNGTMTSLGTDSTTGDLSFPQPFATQNHQWMIVQAILVSTTTSPSYTRLLQIRLRASTTQIVGTAASL